MKTQKSVTHLMNLVGFSLRVGAFEADILRMPGAPNLTAIKNSHAHTRYAQSVRLEREAAKMKSDALRGIVTELREDWTSEQIAVAFTK